MIQVMLLTLETERGDSLGFELGTYLCFLLFLFDFGNCNMTISFYVALIEFFLRLNNL